jgi:hypothetical protein
MPIKSASPSGRRSINPAAFEGSDRLPHEAVDREVGNRERRVFAAREHDLGLAGSPVADVMREDERTFEAGRYLENPMPNAVDLIVRRDDREAIARGAHDFGRDPVRNDDPVAGDGLKRQRQRAFEKDETAVRTLLVWFLHVAPDRSFLRFLAFQASALLFVELTAQCVGLSVAIGANRGEHVRGDGRRDAQGDIIGKGQPSPYEVRHGPRLGRLVFVARAREDRLRGTGVALMASIAHAFRRSICPGSVTGVTGSALVGKKGDRIASSSALTCRPVAPRSRFSAKIGAWSGPARMKSGKPSGKRSTSPSRRVPRLVRSSP